MKISILLPYKENFTVNKSGAVSLFVKDLINNKKKTNLIKVYGDTEEKLSYHGYKPSIKNFSKIVSKMRRSSQYK